MSKTTTSYAQAYNFEMARAAKVAFERMCKEVGNSFYLYFTPHGMMLHIVSDMETPPVGTALVTSERIPSNLTVEQLTGRFHDQCRRIPLLPAD